uniref:Uncharacterized protein n=1 Tax=viral metagenome TaxID=1070528 RepID=A0A6C0H809_9ZZZZ
MDRFAVVIPETINFTELVKNSHTALTGFSIKIDRHIENRVY